MKNKKNDIFESLLQTIKYISTQNPDLSAVSELLETGFSFIHRRKAFTNRLVFIVE